MFANETLSRGRATAGRRLSPAVTTLEGTLSPALLDEVHGGGLLFETRVSALADLASLARRDLQTITTFGFEREDKLDLARRLDGRGGYRIVPVGEALQFAAVWDGIDLVGQFSRLIEVR